MKTNVGARSVKAKQAASASTRFTPGPWFWRLDPFGRLEIRSSATVSGSKFVAKLRIMDGDFDTVEVTQEAEANAALIASATDLYEACQALLSAQEDMTHASDYLPGEKSGRLFEAKDKARLALRKATP